jgi:regulator of sigma E protease
MPFVYFIVLVGVLVFVHELGHFFWAKFFNVKVLKFSLGFGPRLFGFRRGETEYVMAAIPLGGYVRMLGESPLDEIDPADENRALQNQNILKRFIIVVAGPAMNIAFPVLLYFLVFLGDAALTPATVGIVFPDRPADKKLRPGDRIVAVDGDEITTFYELQRIVESNAGTTLRLTLQREGKRVQESVAPRASLRERPLDLTERVGRIGIMPHHPIAAVGVISRSSPAGAAGLKTFDVIVSANGLPVERFIDFAKIVNRNQGALVPLTFLRPHTIRDALGGLAEFDIYDPRVTTLTPDPGPGSGVGRAGLESADLYVSQVTANSPEHRMGLLPGDRLVALDGRPIRLWATFMEDLKSGRGAAHTLTFRRGNRELTRSYTLQHQTGITEHGQQIDRYLVGIRNWVPTRLDPPVDNPNRVLYAARESLRVTAEMIELTVFSMVRLLQGRLSVKSIGGPLTIFAVAGTAAEEGALNYIALMAFISINLGLINLLPIPVLDGGHLMFFAVEAVSRRPLSLRVREYAYIAGLAVLLVIMVLAFKNDIERQWPDIVNLITSD